MKLVVKKKRTKEKTYLGGSQGKAVEVLREELSNVLQPNDIGEPGTEGGPPFILAKSEWVAIQAYSINALSLPTTNDEFRTSIDAEPSFDLADFVQLIAAYDLINQHVTVWENETFPSSVNLAGRIYQYGSQKVPVYYPEVSRLADEIVADPENEKLQQTMKALLENLENTAQGFADEADAVSDAVTLFAQQTQEDKTRLLGPNGNDGLQAYYNDKYGKSSEQVEQLTQEIAAQQIILDAAMDEYNQAVIIAATTPTYAWVPFVGLVAAAVVAGVYGDKAVKALDEAKAASKKIEELNQELRRNALLMLYINNATGDMTKISTSLVEALPAIQKIRGVWGAMAQDLHRIVEIIDEDIRKAIPILQSLGVDQAMLAWQSVAAAANHYRLNAYIVEEVGTGESQEAFNLRSLILGRQVA